MMQIYKGIGTDHCDHEDLIDFLNYVFGMNGFDSGFYRLLPKLYRPAFRPEDHNFIVTEASCRRRLLSHCVERCGA